MSTHRVSRQVLAFLLGALVVAPLSAAAQDYSQSERALFMTHHLEGLHPPVKLSYRYTRTGTLEPGFQDKVQVHLFKRADGSCCNATADFLQGERRLSLPEVEAAQANPVILYFLERDIREMSRLTKGQSAYFRKRIRMAVYQGAKVADLTVSYNGKPVAAQRISISPYADDPVRGRFEKLADKEYTFTLSGQVPGAVYSIRSSVRAANPDAPPLLVEELLVDGATPGRTQNP